MSNIAPARAESAASRAFDIEPQALISAIKQFATQCGCQIMFPPAIPADQKSSGLHGTMDAKSALQILLQGSGFEFRTTRGGVILIDSPKGEPLDTQTNSIDEGDQKMRKQALTFRLTALLGMCASAASTNPACAQSASTAPTDTGGVRLEEIIVTANRTESLASKTPITLTAITGDDLKNSGVVSPLQLDVPNVNIERGNGNGLAITIRGVSSTDNTQKGDPSAAFLLDGVYLPFQNAQEVAFFDLDRVEVLRGPQGTLYGRNTTAGAINVISASPTFTAGGSADLSVGNYDSKSMTEVINVPLSDSVAIRLASNYEYRGAIVNEAGAGQAFTLPPDKDTLSMRLSLLFKPSDQFKLLLKTDYSRIHGAGNSFGSLVNLSNFYKVPLTAPTTAVNRVADPVYLDPSASAAVQKKWVDGENFAARDYVWGATAEMTWSLSDPWTLTWLSGYKKFKRDETGSTYFGTDYSTSPTTDTIQSSFNYSLYDTWSSELRVAYASDKLKAQGGIYYFDYNWNFDLGFSNGFYFDLPAIGESKSKAAFGQATWSFTDKFRVTGGARYTSDDKVQTDAFVPFPPVFGPVPKSLWFANGTTAEAKSNKTTWKVSADYDLTSTAMLYGIVSTGYKAGGVNGGCTNAQFGCVYNPETVTAYELGVKSKLLDDTLRLNADVFHYDYRDRQLGQVVTNPANNSPQFNVTNAAAAKVDGIEVEANLLLNASNRFDLSATWLKARYTDYSLAPGNPTADNYNGEPLDYSPKWTVSGGYSYTLPFSNSSNLVAAIHSRYSSEYVMLSTTAQAFFKQPGFTKTDLSLTYNAPNDRWLVQAFVHNLENSINVTYVDLAVGFPSLNDGKASIGEPRTYGARFGVKF